MVSTRSMAESPERPPSQIEEREHPLAEQAQEEPEYPLAETISNPSEPELATYGHRSGSSKTTYGDCSSGSPASQLTLMPLPVTAYPDSISSPRTSPSKHLRTSH
jgi:hypothetical protein